MVNTGDAEQFLVPRLESVPESCRFRRPREVAGSARKANQPRVAALSALQGGSRGLEVE